MWIGPCLSSENSLLRSLPVIWYIPPYPSHDIRLPIGPVSEPPLLFVPRTPLWFVFVTPRRPYVTDSYLTPSCFYSQNRPSSVLYVSPTPHNYPPDNRSYARLNSLWLLPNALWTRSLTFRFSVVEGIRFSPFLPLVLSSFLPPTPKL